jgi:hypothetical protein
MKNTLEVNKSYDLSNLLINYVYPTKCPMFNYTELFECEILTQEDEEEKILPKKIKKSTEQLIKCTSSSIVSLTHEEQVTCYGYLKQRIRENSNLLNNKDVRKNKLLEVYEQSKNKQCTISLELLNDCCFSSFEKYSCILCLELVDTIYLINVKKCTYHKTCNKCFVFTQSLLRYTLGNREITCVCQRLGTNCRVKDTIDIIYE